jgi:hypothetical protein
MAPPPSPPGPRHRLCNPPLTPSRRPTSRAHRQPHPASIAPNPPANEDGSALHSKPAFHPLPFTSVCSTTPPPSAAPMPSATPATPSPAQSATPRNATDPSHLSPRAAWFTTPDPHHISRPCARLPTSRLRLSDVVQSSPSISVLTLSTGTSSHNPTWASNLRSTHVRVTALSYAQWRRRACAPPGR